MYLIDESVIYEAINKATESTVPAPDKSRISSQSHLDHLEDLIIRKGAKGYDDALNILGKTYDFLREKTHPNFSISTKFDGSPGILWGHMKGKFFVATKAFFNKTPKLNFNDNDIEENHGNSQTLVKKLKLALKHLPEITPKTGIFRGDMMYSTGELSNDKDNISFTPNTISYNVDKNTDEGKSILASKIGLVPHMTYSEQDNGDFKATFESSIDKFKKSPNVHLFDPKVKGPFNFSPDKQKAFSNELMKAHVLKPELEKLHVFETLKDHEPLLLNYINDCVKSQKEMTAPGYISFVSRKSTKHLETVKQIKTKEKLKGELDGQLFKINQNKNGLDILFRMHNHVQNAKKVLINVLSKNSPYKETILGKKTKPEGFVAALNGQPVKLVDRQEFSKANFDWNEKADENDNPMVLSWGKFSVPSIGHERLIDKGNDIARRTGA